MRLLVGHAYIWHDGIYTRVYIYIEVLYMITYIYIYRRAVYDYMYTYIRYHLYIYIYFTPFWEIHMFAPLEALCHDMFKEHLQRSGCAAGSHRVVSIGSVYFSRIRSSAFVSEMFST